MIEPKAHIKKLESYNPPLEGRKDKLRLDFNENTVGPSPKVIKAIKNVLKETISAYPEYEEFYKKLSKYLKIKRSELIVTNASDEAIKLIMDTYIEKGDEIILPVPTFPMFRIYAGLANARLANIFYKDDLSFPVEEILNAINDKTRMVVIVNPNNPTGTPVNKKDIIRIIEKAKNSLVVLDEAYTQFSKASCIALINKYKNLVIVQTFSKAFGLAGLRIGYLVSCEYNIKNIMKVTSPYSVNAMAVLAASAALDDSSYIKWYANEVNKAKKILYAELKKLNIKTYPSSANFILAYFGNKSKIIQDKLRDNGILIRDRSSDPLLKGCLRISVGTVEQTKRFIRLISPHLR